MVAIEHSRDFATSAVRTLGYRAPLVAAASAAGAILFGWVEFTLHSGDLSAARAASNALLGACALIYALYRVAAPLCRVLSSGPTCALSRAEPAIALVFGTVFGVYLLWVLAPYFFARTHVPLPTLSYCVLSAIVAAVLVAGALTAGSRRSAAGRTLVRLAHGYFWFVLLVDNLDHVIGPHRPGHFHDVSLGVLWMALALRLGDAFNRRRKAAMPERPV
jgi:hypothetical protein